MYNIKYYQIIRIQGKISRLNQPGTQTGTEGSSKRFSLKASASLSNLHFVSRLFT